jgi:hypothetical protein
LSEVPLSEIPLKHFSNLSAAVIAQAESDWHTGAASRMELEEFLNSDWFKLLCDVINQKPERTRQAVIEGWGVKSSARGKT